jgi:hypothetical protein
MPDDDSPASVRKVMATVRSTSSLQTLHDAWAWAGQWNVGGDVWLPGERAEGKPGIIGVISAKLAKHGKHFDDLLRFESSSPYYKRLQKEGNPSPGRKSAGEQKMTFEKLHEPFKAWLSEVASEHGKSVEQVFGWWREYTRDCRNYDQSPVESEFLDWYRDKLSASGGENPSPSARSSCGSLGGRGNPMGLHTRLVMAATDYDRKQGGKRGYNRYALAQYLGALQQAEQEIAGGSTARQALVSNFSGRLLDALLKAAGEPGAADEEVREAWNSAKSARGSSEGRGNPSSPVVLEIHRQLLAQGINPRLSFVEWDANTLKVSKDQNGSLIRYNAGTDLYDVTEYHGFDKLPEQRGIYVEGLLDAVMPSLTPREGYGSERNPGLDSGIKFVYGILGKGASRVSEVQSVLLEKARYTVAQAKKWLEDHGFKYGSVDEGGSKAGYLRFRQQDPGKYHSMRTGEAGKSNPDTAELVARMDAALVRMEQAGHSEHPSYTKLRAKRDAIAAGEPYTVTDATKSLIGGFGREIGRLTKATGLRRTGEAGRKNPDYTRFSPGEGGGRLLQYVVTDGNKVVFQSNDRLEAYLKYESLLLGGQDAVLWSRRESASYLKTVLYKKLSLEEKGNPEMDNGVEDEYEEPQEPEEGDLITEDHHHFYQDGKLVVVVPPEHDWENKVCRYMDEENFWPNVWFLSDHGNYHPLTFTTVQSRGNPIVGMGALPPHALIQHPSGVWSFVGRVDARLSYLRKDGSQPSEEELRKAAQFGPGLMGLKTRVWATQEEAEQAAAELGIKVGQVSPHRRGNPEAITPVIFRKWKDSGDVIALFPASVADLEGSVDSYMHVGQHGAASLQKVKQATVPAKPTEYAELKDELERVVGYRLRVVEQDSPAFRAERRKQLREHRRGNPEPHSDAFRYSGEAGAKNPRGIHEFYYTDESGHRLGEQTTDLESGFRLGVTLARTNNMPVRIWIGSAQEESGWKQWGQVTPETTEEAIKRAVMLFALRGRQINPESQSAAALYEQFHGRPSSETLEYREEIEVPDELAGLGDLTEIKVATMSGLDVTLSFEDDPPKLCSTPDGKQLHIIGGDGSLPLDKLKMDGQKWLRDSMVVGVLYELTYRTEKDFHRFSPTDYFHKFADPKEKRSDVEPMLIYDSVNKQLSVSGGQYKISRPGIEG